MADRIDYTGAPQIGPKVDPGGGVSINAPADAFGASLFDAVHGFGQTMQQAALKKQELVNSLDHNDRALNASKELSDVWSKYGQLEGDAAIKGLPDYQKSVMDVYKRYTEDPTAPPAVRQQLSQQLFRDVDRYMSHGANYADTQVRHWHNKLQGDALDNTVNQAVMNRKQPLETLDDIIERGPAGVGGANSVRELMLHKFGPDTDLNDPKVKAEIEGEVDKFRGRAVLDVVEALANEGDVKTADAVLQHYKDRMDGPSYRKVEGFLRPKILDMKTAEIADREKPIPDESGYFPTNAAEQRRLTVGIARPSVEASTALAGRPAGAVAGAVTHPSDFFVKLERGGAGLDYINKKDTDGSHAYGSMGLSSRGGAGGSAAQFARANPHLGLTGMPGTIEFDHAWVKAAHEKGPELRAAEQKWWKEHYLDPVPSKLKAAGVQDSIANNRLVQLYLADRMDQHGEHILDARTGRPGQVTHIERIQEAARQANGDPKKFLDLVRASDVAHLQTDFGKAIETGAYSATSHQTRLNDRMAAAQKALAAEGTPAAGGAPATGTPPAEPQDSVISPGYTARAQARQNNLIRAHALAGGDIQLEHKLRAEFDRRDVLMKTNLSGQRQVVQDTVKNLDLMASKGLPGASLEKAGLSEDYVRSLWTDKPHIAEHIIENNRLQSQLGDKLSSMKFASKEEWDNLLRDTNQGLGIDTMIQEHRKGMGTTSAFEMGSDPEANGEIMSNNFALKEKLAGTVRKAWTDRQAELAKDPAAFLVSSRNPAIMKAAQEVQAAKTPVDVQAAFRRYAALQTSIQREIGVPTDKIRVMSVAKAEEQANFIMKSQDAKGELEKMKATYGDLYPAVFRDVVALGKLPPKFEALGELDNQNAGLLAGRIKAEAAVKGAEHQREMRTLLEKDVGKISSATHDNDTMKTWMRSMAIRGISDPQRAEAVNTVNMLAQARVMELKEDPKTAADEAVKAFTKNIKFTKDDVAIPADKHDAVMSEAHDKLSWLNSGNIQVPKFFSDKGYDGASYANYAKSTGSWKATPDGNGMYLIDHSGHPVITTDGNLVKVMYDKPEHSISSRQNMPKSWKTSLGSKD